MNNNVVIKVNICRTTNFLDDGVLLYPQTLNLAQQKVPAVYLGLDEKVSPQSLFWVDKLYRKEY